MTHNGQQRITWNYIIGKKVKSIDNQDIGKVESVLPEYVQTKEGGKFSRKYYFIPKYYFESYDGNDIWISLRKDEVKSRFERDTAPSIEESSLEYLKRRQKIESGFSEFNEGIPYGKMIRESRRDNIITKEVNQTVVFVSYIREDREAATRLYRDLKNADLNLKPWIDTQLLPGQRWEPEIKKAIETCRYFIPLFSSRILSKETGYTKKEFEYALKVIKETQQRQKIIVIPVRPDDCKIPYSELGKIQHVDLFPDWNKGLKKILDAIELEISFEME